MSEAVWPEMKRHAPATQRNRGPIAQVLADELPASGRVLEIASGTGEHAAYFAETWPGLVWQPSDPDAAARRSIEGWRQEKQLSNLLRPLAIDIAKDDLPPPAPDAVVCINMVHISDWAATIGLFRGCAGVLPKGAPLILYGPYIEDGVETAPSNLAFDRSLKERNSSWGLRHVADVDRLAAKFGFARTRRVEMPANNLMLVYRKPAPDG